MAFGASPIVVDIVGLNRTQFADVGPTSSSRFTRNYDPRTGSTFVMHHRDPSCLLAREGVHRERLGLVVTPTSRPADASDSWPCPNCIHVPQHTLPRPQTSAPRSRSGRARMHLDNISEEKLHAPAFVGLRSVYGEYRKTGKLNRSQVDLVLRGIEGR